MLSCKKAAELIDKKSVVKLSRGEKMQLKLHLSICEGCEIYQKQSKIIGNLIARHFGESQESEVTQKKNEELKERIKSKL